MSARDLQPGEMVRATIDVGRVESVDADAVVVEVGAAQIMLPLDEDTVTIERLAPADWPPRPDDLWRDRSGRRWLAGPDDGDQVLYSGDGKVLTADGLLSEAGPLSLVYREGWTPAVTDPTTSRIPMGDVTDADLTSEALDSAERSGGTRVTVHCRVCLTPVPAGTDVCPRCTSEAIQ